MRTRDVISLLPCLCALAILVPQGETRGALLVSTPTFAGVNDTTRPTTTLMGPATLLDVSGVVDLYVNQFGFFGRILGAQPAEIKFVIFHNGDTSPFFQSTSQSVSPSGDSLWIDSTVFESLKLLAGHSYLVGVAINSGSVLFTRNNNSPLDITANGLTIRNLSSDLVLPYANPTHGAYTTNLQPSFRVFSGPPPAVVPEPSTWALGVLGCLGLVACRLRSLGRRH